MSTRVSLWVVPLLLVAAGCIGAPQDNADLTITEVEDPDPQPTTKHQPPTNHQPTTMDPGNGGQEPIPSKDRPTTNQPPLLADLAAPTSFLSIPFALPVTLSSDRADGSDLDWRFDGNGDGVWELSGRGLPHHTTVPVTEPGLHLLRLAVTDGTQTAEDTLELVATAPDTKAATASAPPIENPLDLRFWRDVGTGTVPLAVTFHMAGGHGAGLPVTWSLDADGDGSPDADGDALPAQAGFDFTAPGTYRAVATLTDGTFHTERAFWVHVEEAAGGGTAFPLTLSHDVALFCQHCFWAGLVVSDPCAGWIAGQNGIDCAWSELPADAGGQPFTTTSPIDSDAAFYAECAALSTQLAVFAAEGHESGTVPADAGCVVLWDFAEAGRVSITIG